MSHISSTRLTPRGVYVVQKCLWWESVNEKHITIHVPPPGVCMWCRSVFGGDKSMKLIFRNISHPLGCVCGAKCLWWELVHFSIQRLTPRGVYVVQKCLWWESVNGNQISIHVSPPGICMRCRSVSGESC